jgi:hypothetical protein
MAARITMDEAGSARARKAHSWAVAVAAVAAAARWRGGSAAVRRREREEGVRTIAPRSRSRFFAGKLNLEKWNGYEEYGMGCPRGQ